MTDLFSETLSAVDAQHFGEPTACNQVQNRLGAFTSHAFTMRKLRPATDAAREQQQHEHGSGMNKGEIHHYNDFFF